MPSTTRPGLPDRITIHRFAQEHGADSFAEEIRAGLTASPKTTPPKYFYDDLGSQLFEAICRLPEYYLTRAESEILREYADEIIGAVRGPARLIELGSGSADKTRYLFEALLRRQSNLHYIPVDISEASIERSSALLLHLYPRMHITAYNADYFTALGALHDAGPPEAERTIALFLGSNIGNFNPEESRAFLREIRRMLRPEDVLLVGADLKKPADVLVPAYDDALGVTAAFNRNLLVRRFRHRAVYNEQLGRIEAYLVSLAPQRVRLRALDLEIAFEEGEAIHTENSHKFDLEELAELARVTGFALERAWLDKARRFSFNLFAAS